MATIINPLTAIGGAGGGVATNVPEPTIDDAGKSLQVDNTGNYALGYSKTDYKFIDATINTTDWEFNQINNIYNYQAVITLQEPLDNSNILELINNQSIFSIYGFNILSCDLSTITIISVGCPIENITLTFKISKVKLDFENGGTSVIANPDEEATETLTSLKIGNTTYSISSDGGDTTVENSFTVTFKVDDVNYAVYNIKDGDSITEPSKPTKTDYSFLGWYNSDDEKIKFPYTPEMNITLTAKFQLQIIIGFTGFSNSSGELTWTDDIADYPIFTTTNIDTNNVQVTSDLDNIFPFNQITEFTDIAGNVFVKFPRMYISWVKIDGVIDGIRISNTKVDDTFFIPDCFLHPDMSGEYVEYFALGKYEGSGSSSIVYSKTEQTCLVNVTRANVRSGCRSYGNSANYYNGYQQYDASMFTLYSMLCSLYFKTANLQTIYGGRTSYGTGKTWSSASVTGTTDLISKNGWNTSTDCVKMLGVENPYGNVWIWCDGMFFSGTSIYVHRYPTQFADSTTNAQLMEFVRPSANGYISKMKVGESETTKSFIFTSENAGSETTYSGDHNWYNSGERVFGVGGSWGNGSQAGLWALIGDVASSSSASSLGGRLCCRSLV